MFALVVPCVPGCIHRARSQPASIRVSRFSSGAGGGCLFIAEDKPLRLQALYWSMHNAGPGLPFSLLFLVQMDGKAFYLFHRPLGRNFPPYVFIGRVSVLAFCKYGVC